MKASPQSSSALREARIVEVRPNYQSRQMFQQAQPTSARVPSTVRSRLRRATACHPREAMLPAQRQLPPALCIARPLSLLLSPRPKTTRNSASRVLRLLKIHSPHLETGRTVTMVHIALLHKRDCQLRHPYLLSRAASPRKEEMYHRCRYRVWPVARATASADRRHVKKSASAVPFENLARAAGCVD